MSPTSPPAPVRAEHAPSRRLRRAARFAAGLGLATAALAICPGASDGPDVIVGSLFDLEHYTDGGAIDGMRAYAVGTRSLNIGDADLRWIASTKQDQASSYPALSSRLASLVTRSPVTAGVAIVPGFRTPPSAVPVVSAADILGGTAASVPDLRDRIVLIGITAIGLGDRVITPRTPRHQTDAGVLVHAATVESLLAGDVFHELSPLTGGVMAAGLVWFTLRAALIARGRPVGVPSSS